METVISARELTKRYGDLVAVDSINFSVAKGECFGLLGPNGAGKTSVMRMATCVSPVTQGTLTVLGMDVKREPRAVKEVLGIVPQQDALDPDLTVHQNLVAYTRYFGIPRRVAEGRIREVLILFDLLDKKNDFLDTLSGGMKRRLMIARALMSKPRLLVLDEPTTGLDPQARRLVWDRLLSLKEQGVTTVLSTHYMEEAYYLCDRLVIMDKGSILAEGSPRDLVERYAGLEAVEVRPQAKARQAVLGYLREWGLKVENTGETIYAFPDNGTSLPKDMSLEGAIVIRRTATLEDVFMLLTGRTLGQE